MNKKTEEPKGFFARYWAGTKYAWSNPHTLRVFTSPFVEYWNGVKYAWSNPYIKELFIGGIVVGVLSGTVIAIMVTNIYDSNLSYDFETKDESDKDV